MSVCFHLTRSFYSYSGYTLLIAWEGPRSNRESFGVTIYKSDLHLTTSDDRLTTDLTTLDNHFDQ